MNIFSPRSRDCTIQGHRFQARYDEKPRDGEASGRMSLEALREVMVTRTYVQDICIYCGQVIARGAQK